MQNSREKLLDFTALSLGMITSLVMAIFAFLEYGQDFRGYYAAARVLLERNNPYDYTQVARVLLEVTGRTGNNPFYYPLWFGWFITPLSLLPFQTARVFWMLFNWAMWIIGLLRLQQLMDFPRKGWRNWLINLLATFVFAWMTWKFEQTGILLFIIMVEVLIAYKKQQWNRMGIFLALALIKPNVMLVPVIALVLWLVRNRNWRPVVVTGIALVALIVITTALTPDWYQPFFQPHFGQGLTEVLDGPNQIISTRLNTTLLDLLKWFSVPKNVQIVIYTVVGLAGVWILLIRVWKSKSILDISVTALLVSFAITPYALQYDFPPLTIVLFWILARLSRVKSEFLPTLMVALIASVLVWERPISDGYWIVIGLIVLAAWASKFASVDRCSQSLI